MSAAAAATLDLPIEISPELFDAVNESTPKTLAMCGCSGHCVGISQVPSNVQGEVTGMIGLHGAVSGFAAVNMSKRLAMHVVGSFLSEEYDDITPIVLDGAGEVTNIIVGGIKSSLSRTDWAFSQITVPSVIVGEGYKVAYARGMELIDVAFEVDNPRAISLADRLLHVTLSLLKV